MKQSPAHNKNYMSIGVSVRTTKFAARNPDGYPTVWTHLDGFANLRKQA